jgi:hypothetical protein
VGLGDGGDHGRVTVHRILLDQLTRGRVDGAMDAHDVGADQVRTGRRARRRSKRDAYEMIDADTVALIYDETDGLGFYAEVGVVEEAFANPGLLRRRRWREQSLSYLHDDSVEPMVLRRLADRDPDKASVVFRRLLKRPRFDWNRDGEELMREVKPGYFVRSPRPRVSPLSERLGGVRRAAVSSGSAWPGGPAGRA